MCRWRPRRGDSCAHSGGWREIDQLQPDLALGGVPRSLKERGIRLEREERVVTGQGADRQSVCGARPHVRIELAGIGLAWGAAGLEFGDDDRAGNAKHEISSSTDGHSPQDRGERSFHAVGNHHYSSGIDQVPDRDRSSFERARHRAKGAVVVELPGHPVGDCGDRRPGSVLGRQLEQARQNGVDQAPEGTSPRCRASTPSLDV